MTEPTTLLCITCAVFRPKGNPRRPNRPMVCDGDRQALSGFLVDLPPLYIALDQFLEPGTVGGERRSGAFESRLPMNVTVFSLLGPGLGTPLGLMGTWAADWAGIRRETQPDAGMFSLCAWLIDRLDWACDEHDAVDEFAADLKHMLGVIKAVTGKERGEKVGRCPQRLGDGTRCDTQLYVDPYVDTIVCSRCRMEWKRKAGQWMHLRGQQLAAGVESAEAA